MQGKLFISMLFCFILPVIMCPAGMVTTDDDKSMDNGMTALAGVNELYINLADTCLKPEALYYGLKGHDVLTSLKQVTVDSLLTIIDYSLPSSEPRFFIIDLKNKRLLCKSLVAHGRNSGEVWASRFSNQPQSYKSSLGFYITGSSYTGQNGYSMWLNGLDTLFNDLAKPRAIVIHGAPYVNNDYILKNGRLGRSFGCPALPAEICCEVIDLIKNGSVVFSYYPDPEYLEKSRIIKDIPHPEWQSSLATG